MREVVNQVVGRYALGHAIASGGMATLHLGRLVGSAGFARMVAIKRLHPQFCADPNFVEAFADEARLAARIRHPNVVPTLDVVSTEASANGPGELLLVMEYIDGESLSALARATTGPIPLPIVVAIVSEMLHGLHSAHEAKSEKGEPLGIVHRDISPQNVLVGADGVARLVDFGIARATGKVGTTNEGELKGKLAYMAPEQIRRERVTRKSDIFAAGVVLWELLTGQRLFASDNPGATLEKILVGWVAAPSTINKDLPPSFDEIALRALDAEPSNRFETAREMAVALEDATQRALGRDVATWVESTAKNLAQRRELVAAAERAKTDKPENTLRSSDVATPVPPSAKSAHSSRSVPPPPSAPTPARVPTSEETCTLAREPRNTTEVIDLDAEFDPAFTTEPTVFAFGGSDTLDPSVRGYSQPPPPPPPTFRRNIGTTTAILTFVLAATVTVFVGTRYSAPPPRSIAASGDTVEPSVLVTTAVTPGVTPPATTTPVPVAVPVRPLLAPTAALTPAPSPVIPAVRRPAKARSLAASPAASPAHSPCREKLDPVTGKIVYKGDCD